MPRRTLISVRPDPAVSDERVADEIGLFPYNDVKVAWTQKYQGAPIGDTQVYQVRRMCVAIAGRVREFYPYYEEPAGTAPVTDPQIVFNGNAISALKLDYEPASINCILKYFPALGVIKWNADPDGVGETPILNPVLDGTPSDDNKYLIKVDQTGGDLLTGTLGTWIDANAPADIDWRLPRSTVGEANATANFSVAKDDGLGAPLPDTIVTAAVTFKTIIYNSDGGTSDNVWTDIQRDLYDQEQRQTATCSLRFNINGIAEGIARTGSFTERWLAEGGDATGFTVTVTGISGDVGQLEGDPLGVALPLNTGYLWELNAYSEGDDWSVDLDVTVSDGTVSETKRVTMRSNYDPNQIITDLAFDDTPWDLTDKCSYVNDFVSEGRILLNSGGRVVGTVLYDGTEIVENWHSDAPSAPDPYNYEARLDLAKWRNLREGSEDDGTWINLGQGTISWTMPWYTIDDGPQQETWYLSVRQIGGEAITKAINWDMGYFQGVCDDPPVPVIPTDTTNTFSPLPTWNLSDLNGTASEGDQVTATISVRQDGRVTGATNHGAASYDEPWLSTQTPTPDDLAWYEVYLEVLGGSEIDPGQSDGLNQWIRMTGGDLSWVTVTTAGVGGCGNLDTVYANTHRLLIRKIGEDSVDKTITIFIGNCTGGGTPPPIVDP